MNRYNVLSGKITHSATAYGVLEDAIVWKKLTIYIDRNQCYSFDKQFWSKMNKGLYQKLLQLREIGCKNIVMVEENK